ncbi:MAG TPA: TonB-dependent receptor [Gemmatimonadales bacterium]|nr:TonB-dependent receptor [Gemmatimonadales bacterium]
MKSFTLLMLAAVGALLGRPLAGQQPASLAGQVVDAATGAAMAGAEVRLADLAVRTDDQGNFRFGTVSPGRQVVVVRRIGFRPDTSSIEITPGLERRIVVPLHAAAIYIAPLSIRGAPAGAAIIDGAQLALRGMDLGTALDGWAGVSVRRTGGATAVPQVRGSAPEEVLVLLDGITINDPLTGRADLSRIPVNEVDRVELLPGTQTARVGGRAIAGVIEIATRSDAAPSLTSGIGSFGTWNARGTATVLGLDLSAGVTELPDDYPAADRSGAPAFRVNAGGTTWEASLRARGSVDATLRISGADRGLPGNVTNPSSTGQGTDRSAVVVLGHDGAFSWSVTGDAVSARSWDPSAPPRGIAYDDTTRSAGGSVAATLRRPAELGSWSGEVTVGADGRYDGFSGNGVQPGADFARGGVHLGTDLGHGEWSISPVLRADHWSGWRGAAITGRLDAEWRRDRTVVSLGVGNGITPPVPFDLLFREGVGVALNPGLRPERVAFELTGDVRQGGRLLGIPGTLSLRGYAGRVHDLVVWSAGPNFVWSPQNVDVVRRGGELELELRPGTAWTFTGGVALSFINFSAAPHFPVAYRPRDTEHAAAAWTTGRWRMNVGWRRLGPRPQYDNGDWNLPAIGLVDAGVERRLGRALVARLDVRDLTDRRPEYVAGMPLPGRSVLVTLTYGAS